MAVLDIIKYGDPILRQVAEPYDEGEVTGGFVEDMIETMQKRDGVGLAAPQVGISKRLIIVSDLKEIFAIINPEIVAVSEQLENDIEGCLSIPGIQGSVARSKKIIVRGIKPGGEKVEITAKGLLARVCQHEIDHLNGVLFIDRSEPDSITIAEDLDLDESEAKYRKTNINEVQTLYSRIYYKGQTDLRFEPV